jgi:hypothetical protein
MYWLSGAESEKFVKSVEDALEKVKNSGPNPVNIIDSDTEIKTKETKQVITTPAE